MFKNTQRGEAYTNTISAWKSQHNGWRSKEEGGGEQEEEEDIADMDVLCRTGSGAAAEAATVCLSVWHTGVQRQPAKTSRGHF